MTSRSRSLALFAGLLLLTPPTVRSEAPQKVRFATFNASLNRDAPGALVRDLSTPDDPQARNVAEIIQRVAPDVLLINEFDFDPDGRAADLFGQNYLARGQNGAEPIAYPHRYQADVNTGLPSGFDLNNDGRVVTTPGDRGYGDDCLGFGLFPGQYGMLLLSKYPIDRPAVRSFETVLWKSQPGALLPTAPDGTPWYAPEELAVLRLSSKSHWDVPIRVGGTTIHVLASHPTPPAFDGPEDRNGRRNHDEIRLWADYLSGGDRAASLGGGPAPGTFVLMGDQNADPADGGSVPGAIDQLLKHPKVDARFVPRSDGAAEAARLQGGANAEQRGDPAHDTADFDDRSVGNLRVDYVLPSRDLTVRGGGVFWPAGDDPLAHLVRMRPEVASSDHRLVYLDLELPAPALETLRPGDTGAAVEDLQKRLRARPDVAPELSVDGDYGAGTRAAVLRFQQEEGLPPTGVADARTRRALGTGPIAAPAVPAPEVVNAEVPGRRPPDPLDGPPFVTAKAWAVADGRTGEVLWGEAEDRPLEMASTTKIMTALVVLRLAARDPGLLDETVTFSERADRTIGSTSGVRAGERLPVRELLYGLLLPSGNDASVALAEHVGGRLDPPADAPEGFDPLPRFVAEMNRVAAELGLDATRFANTHGLPARDHRSSARDLARLAHVALADPTFAAIVATPRRGCTVVDAEGSRRNVVWTSTNRLLRIEGYDGVKTGTTSAAGACLVASGRRGDDRLIVVVLGSGSSDGRYADARNLFRWAWKRLGRSEP